METGTPLFLGLDSGTQSAKAGIWDARGDCVARASRPLTVHTPREGWAEQDPAHWWSTAAGAISEAVSQVDAARVAALGVSFQRETFTLLDDEGKAVRPAVLWLDIRAAAEVGEAARRVGAAQYPRRTGKPLDVTSVVPRMLWMARHEPRSLERAQRWTDVGAYLIECLTGTPGTVIAGADTTGLVDLDTRWWAPDHLAACGLDRIRMPGLFEPGSLVGTLAREAARATGLAVGLPVVAGGGDGQCAAVGMGAGIGRGFTLALGTSVVLGVPHQSRFTSPLYRTLIAARPDRQYLRESVIQSGTYIVKWFEDTFGEPGSAEIHRGSDGLVTVPHWWGVRFPESLPSARGATFGWSHLHTTAHFHRSILEGVAFELRKLADDHREALDGGVPARIAACGGGTRNRTWLEILAEVTACSIEVPSEPEPAALGAAMLAAVGARAFPDLDSAAAAMGGRREVIRPEEAGAAAYDALYRGAYLPLREAALRLGRQAPAS